VPSSISLNIKSPEVHQAAVRLAKLQGISITAAVLKAVRADLERVEDARRGHTEVRRMEEYARRVAALPVLDTRTDDEILGYGSEGYLVGD